MVRPKHPICDPANACKAGVGGIPGKHSGALRQGRWFESTSRSDTHQLNLHLEDYHGPLDRRLGACVRGREMITELYVPRDRLVALMDAVRADFRAHETNCIYGTIRLIDADTESALRWARSSWACVIFNLQVDHRPEDIELASHAFRRLIARALDQSGSYFLTYCRFASSDQLRAAHPGIGEFLNAKARLDPEGRFQSECYRHIRGLLP